MPDNDPVTVGTDDSADQVFWNTSTASWYADKGAAGVGIFRKDTGWTPNGTVAIQIKASTPAPQTVSVHIFKFIDNVQATATIANNAAFPMSTTYTSSNIGSATDAPFTLSPTGWGSTDGPYEASFVNSNPGANYATHEVTGGTVVGADCSAGAPFALVGYSVGDTLAAAQAAPKTTTTPSFTNLQKDEYVIVWNKPCLEAPVNVYPADGSTYTTATFDKTDWTDVTSPFPPVVYFYESANDPTLNADGSFAHPVYQSGALTVSEIPTPGTPQGTWYWHARAQDADGNVSPWSAATKVIVDNTPPPAPIKVHILKYLDGNVADATSAGGYLFPMTATWNAVNIGSGSGSYVLGNGYGGAADLYGADTSAMSVPADYSTAEVVDDASSKVVSSPESCAPGKYLLNGYRVSAVSFSDAATQQLQASAVFTGLASDEYVIVDNSSCPTTGSLTVYKSAIGGDGTFSFVGDNGVGVFSITTISGVGTVTFNDLTPGTYHVTESPLQKWTMTDSDCASVQVLAGGTAECTVTNTNNKLLGEIRGTVFERS